MEDIYLLYYTLSWEEEEKMCAVDTLEIFNDFSTPSEKMCAADTSEIFNHVLTPSEKGNTFHKSLQENEDTCRIIKEKETMQELETINGECTLMQDHEYVQKNNRSSSSSVDTEQKSLQVNYMNKENYSNTKLEIFDDSLLRSFRSTNFPATSSSPQYRTNDQSSTEVQPMWPLIESSFSIVSSKSNNDQNFKFPPMNSSIKQSARNSKKKLRNIVPAILRRLALPLAIDEVATQQSEKPKDDNLELPPKMSNPINQSSCNPKTITSDVLARLNFHHGTEILPPGTDEVATQQEQNLDTQSESTLIEFPFRFTKTAENRLKFYKSKIDSYQQKVRRQRAQQLFTIKTDLRNQKSDTPIGSSALKNIAVHCVPHDRKSSQFSTKAPPIWPVIESSFSIVSNSSSQPNGDKNLNLPLMNNSIEQSSQNAKTKLQNIAVPDIHGAEILPSLPPATDKVATLRENCNKPKEDENLKLPQKMNNPINLSCCNPKTITSDVLARLNFHHGTEILPPLPPGADEVATQQFPSLFTKTAENRLKLYKSKIDSYQQKAKHQRAHLLRNLTNHSDKEHSYRLFSCEQCDKRFRNNRALRNHLQIHSSEKGFKCNLCEKVFMKIGTLRIHMLVHTKKSKHFCGTCYKYFTSNRTLQIHIKKQHTVERPFKCSICDKGFVTKSILKNHLKRVHMEREFKCEECGKEFVHESELKDHQFIHTGEKPYKCEICGKCFVHKKSLYTHEADHINKNKWNCVKCNKAFKRSFHLKQHMLTHSDNKPFECDVCKKTFNRKSYLKLHSKVHTEEYLQKVAHRRKSTRKAKMKEKLMI